eukprot:TRINITY_DN84353_c0_g1_i1.p1 TRINITY_DN84353_c0_g1~~TRINITY_DN84353_c0_g1_i1.p1  ORF type:complete len:121 (-),score=14.16 TRINITY_DN84353_c0_g1_i1:34-396(-)
MAFYANPNVQAQSWNTGLFSCTEEMTSCVKGALCPFYLLGKNKSDVDGRRMSFLDMALCPSEYATRQQLRSKYDLGYQPMQDLLAVMLCWPCVLCQDARELALRKQAMAQAYRPTTLDMD